MFEVGGTAQMVTEYVEGRTLAERLAAEGPLSDARVRELLLTLTDGLPVVHAAGLLHREHQASEPDAAVGRNPGADRLRVCPLGDRRSLKFR